MVARLAESFHVAQNVGASGEEAVNVPVRAEQRRRTADKAVMRAASHRTFALSARPRANLFPEFRGAVIRHIMPFRNKEKVDRINGILYIPCWRLTALPRLMALSAASR